MRQFLDNLALKKAYSKHFLYFSIRAVELSLNIV